jgi:nitrogen regulatory protein PII
MFTCIRDMQRAFRMEMEVMIVKLVKCIIQPYRLDEVKEALAGIKIQGMTVSEVKGFGRQKGHKELYRGAEYTVDFVPKIEIELVVPDNLVKQVLDAVVKAARSGKVGDGKIFVMNVEEAVRIRTGEAGDAAL